MTDTPRPPGAGPADSPEPQPATPPSPQGYPDLPPYSAPPVVPPPMPRLDDLPAADQPPTGEPPSYPPPPGTGYPPPGTSSAAAPGAGYPPPPGAATGGYQAGPGAPPPGAPIADDRTWILVAHFGGAVGAVIGAGVLGWVAPLIAMLVRGPQSPTVRSHAVASLNFQLLCSIAALVGWITTCLFIGGLIVLAATAIAVIISIIAGLKAAEGTPYRYPINITLVR